MWCQSRLHGHQRVTEFYSKDVFNAIRMNERMFNDTPGQNINQVLGVRQMVS